jgi:integrase/recombinase XerD
MPTRHRMELGLYDARGHRKYLTTAERAAFLSAAEEAPREVRTLCGLLAHTGCRLSEALWLTADRVDLRADLVVFETLKKRRSGVYRAVPVPHMLVDMLDLGIASVPSRDAAIAAAATASGPGAG